MIVKKNNQPPLDTIRIGIWGTVSAGKTIYLTRLYEILNGAFNNDKDEKNQQIKKDWLIRGDDKATSFVTQHSRALNNQCKNGSLPDATPNQTKIDVFHYTMTATKENGDFHKTTIVLEFLDPSGELFNNPKGNIEIKNEITKKNYKSIIQYLMNCHGIIFLLDPFRPVNNNNLTYDELLNNLFTEFTKRPNANIQDPVTRLEQYMAFCVTKVDATDELWTERSQVSEQLVQEVMGNCLWNTLSNFVDLDRCHFYPVSAFGRYENDDGEIVSPIEYSQPVPIVNPTPPANPTPPVTSTGSNTSGPKNPWNPPSPSGGNQSHTTLNNPSSGFPSQQEEEESNPTQSNAGLPYVKKGAKIQPINIVEPLLWLITSIKKNPPKLPNHQQNN